MKSGDIVIKEAIGIGDNEVDALNDAKSSLVLTKMQRLILRLSREPKRKNSVFSEVSLQRLGLLSKKLLQKKQNSF